MDHETRTRVHALARVIGARVRRLSPACRRMLSRASVLGRELDPRVLRRLAAEDDAALEDLIAEARSAGMLVEVPGEGRRLRFAHALLRDACYETLHPTVRARLHRRAAELLAFEAPKAAEIAHHLAAGAREEDRLVAAERLLQAALGALRSLAFEEAVRLCGRGLRILGDPPPAGPSGATLRGRLLRGLEEALRGAAAPPSRS